jgi:hypothetical protein
MFLLTPSLVCCRGSILDFAPHGVNAKLRRKSFNIKQDRLSASLGTVECETAYEGGRAFMTSLRGIPKGAAVAINDLLDHCVKIKTGQEVVLLAHIDGLYGGDNLVDEEAVSWIQSAIQHRGANASVLWIDEPAKPHAWRLPPLVKAALEACDVLINNSFDITFEEIVELRRVRESRSVPRDYRSCDRARGTFRRRRLVYGA